MQTDTNKMKVRFKKFTLSLSLSPRLDRCILTLKPHPFNDLYTGRNKNTIQIQVSFLNTELLRTANLLNVNTNTDTYDINIA